jgi:hypothetical protein
MLMIVDIVLCYLSQMAVAIAGTTCTSPLAASPNDRRIHLEWQHTACRIGARPHGWTTNPVLARSYPKPRFLGGNQKSIDESMLRLDP